MTFDEKVKALARRETPPIPNDFDDKIDRLLRGLPESTAPSRRLTIPFRRVVTVAIAALFVVGAGAAATPSMRSLAKNVIHYFQSQQDSRFSSQKEIFEQFNAAVGISQTRDDTTLTIENIAVDDSYFYIFYTLTSQTPIEKVGDAGIPEKWRAEWTAPVFWARVDGKELDTSGSIQNEARFVDDYTLTGVHQLPLKEKLPDTFALQLYTGDTSDLADSAFLFQMSIDKSAIAVESRTVEPKQDIDIHLGNSERSQDFSVRVERVSISPLGSSITLSEQVKLNQDEQAPFDSFILRDENGTNLPVSTSSGLTYGGIPGTRFSNVFEFIGAAPNTKSLTFIPALNLYRSHEVTGDIHTLPLTDNPENGRTLESLEVTPEKAVATFSVHGAIINPTMEFTLLNENGEEPDFFEDMFLDSVWDRETGLYTVTIFFESALTQEQLAQIQKVMFWQPEPVTLLEEQAVTIPLSE